MATTEAPGNLNSIMMDAAVDMSLAMTAKMFGMQKETVAKVVQAGLPMMAKMAQENPDLFSAMYAQSVKMLPEPMQAFYAKLAESPAAQAKVTEEFSTMYGPLADALNREVASQTGTTPAQAGQILSTTMPALSQAIGKATEGSGEAGMMSWLKGIGQR